MKLETKALAGQISATIITMLQQQRLIFGKLPEVEQRAAIEACERLAVNVVDQTLDLVAGQGSTILNGTMKNVTYKGDVCSTTVTFDLTEEGVHDLSRKSHKSVKIAYIPGAEDMKSLGKRTKPSPDQPAMFTDSDDGEPLFHEDGRVNDPLPAKSALMKESTTAKAEKEMAKEFPAVKKTAVKKTAPKKAAPKKAATKPRSPTAGKKAPAAVKAPRKRRVAAPADMDLASDG